MRFEQLLAAVGEEPLFESGLLLAGDVDAADVQRQLSRWTSAGRLVRLRRGLYALAPPFRKASAHPFVVANRVVRGSYVSLESALAHHGLIPEHVPVVTSVTTARPGTWRTELGIFLFRHVAPKRFGGYQLTPLVADQQAFVATPEKALLDLVHLRRGGDAPEFLAELRLQNLEIVDRERLLAVARAAASPKLVRAAEIIVRLAEAEAEEYEPA